MQTMEVNGRSFQVKELLGKGKGGYSYLVTLEGQEYVLKQIHHEPCDYYTFGDKLASELRDYEILRQLEIPMPRLLEADISRERILKEYIPGETVDRYVLRGQMLPGYYDQIHGMCAKLYAAGKNIDYYPTNFVVRDGALYYVDYECNEYMEQWDFEHWGFRYWERSDDFLAAFPK